MLLLVLPLPLLLVVMIIVLSLLTATVLGAVVLLVVSRSLAGILVIRRLGLIWITVHHITALIFAEARVLGCRPTLVVAMLILSVLRGSADVPSMAFFALLMIVALMVHVLHESTSAKSGEVVRVYGLSRKSRRSILVVFVHDVGSLSSR